MSKGQGLSLLPQASTASTRSAPGWMCRRQARVCRERSASYGDNHRHLRHSRRPLDHPRLSQARVDRRSMGPCLSTTENPASTARWPIAGLWTLVSFALSKTDAERDRSRYHPGRQASGHTLHRMCMRCATLPGFLTAFPTPAEKELPRSTLELSSGAFPSTALAPKRPAPRDPVAVALARGKIRCHRQLKWAASQEAGVPLGFDKLT